MFDEYDADVIVDVATHEEGVVGRNEEGDEDEGGGADDPSPAVGASALEGDREIGGRVSLDREAEYETRRVVREQVVAVLEDLADDGVPVDDVEAGIGEVETAKRREDLRQENADEEEGVGNGENQEVDVGGETQHSLRGKDEEA